MRVKHIAAAALLAALAVAAAPASAQLAEGVAAIVNDHVISTYDVRQRANMILAQSNMQPTQELQQQARAIAVRDLIDERLQLEEAKRYEIAITPDQIDRRIADIARANQVTPEQFQATLAQSGIPIGTLRQQIEADIAWQRLMSGLYGNRVRVSEVEVREEQARIANNATRPQYHIFEIFLPASTEAEFQEMMATAQRLIQEMQRGAPFPAVARQFSQSASAAAGGDVGWIAANELAPELQPVAERLQPQQVSLPVRTPNGVYIIAVVERRAAAAAGSATVLSLRQVSAPAARANQLERLQRRIAGCGNLERESSDIQGASVIDLGQTTEADLSPAIRQRVSEVAVGSASAVETSGDTASLIVVCAREAGGAAVPDRQQIEARLRESELSLLSDRYLRNLRREATIITRQ